MSFELTSLPFRYMFLPQNIDPVRCTKVERFDFTHNGGMIVRMVEAREMSNLTALEKGHCVNLMAIRNLLLTSYGKQKKS